MVSVKKKCLTILLSVIVASWCIACGYHFSPGGEHIDKSMRTVFVDNFSNLTSEANLENYVRNALINQFRRGSRFDLAEGKAVADAYVTGRVKRSDVSHASYRRTDIAREDRVNLTLEIAFKKTTTNQIIWMDRNFTGKEAFLVENDPNATEINRKNALQKLANDMAERAYRSIMSDF